MNTIYNLLHPNEPVNKDVIEIFNMYDYRIYLVALDGKIVEEIHDSDYESYVLDNKFLKKCLKKSGVNNYELLFTLYNFNIFANIATNNMYDMNNYGYQEMYDLIKNNPQHKDSLNTSIIAHGVEF